MPPGSRPSSIAGRWTSIAAVARAAGRAILLVGLAIAFAGSGFSRILVIALVVIAVVGSGALVGSGFSRILAAADPPLPELTEPVNDFAGVIDAGSKDELDRLIRALKSASGDVVVVATVSTFEPYGDIREYAVKLFENHGKGIGDRGKDNGALILVALKERKVWVEVGYRLEEWITDGFAGEISRDFMAPEFRNSRYGAGLVAGTSRIIGRIAQGRGVTLTGVDIPRAPERSRVRIPIGALIWLTIILIIFLRNTGGPRRGMRGWGGGGWSGWSSGVGGFGGGFGGRSGGFGGGFGGFGGGRSGGGGGGAGW